jgi:hypothetical protein
MTIPLRYRMGGSTSVLTGRTTPLLCGALALAVLVGPRPAKAQDDAGCDRCHGEVELLRQHVPSLADAQSLTVTAATITASAHAEETCSSCHTGYDRWPHPEAGTTATCLSCHEEQGDLWQTGLHADPRLDELEPADCTSCHGTHEILTLETLRETEGIRVMNAACVSCHETQALAVTDPHADSVSCGACHGPHATLGIDDAEAGVAPLLQTATCGDCHEDAAAAFPSDGHGAALTEANIQTLAALDLRGIEGPPTCTSCHGGHGMVAIDDTASVVLHVDACASCHADEADRYFGTYHGKATALGSEVVASCDDCHGAHGVFVSTEPASWVHDTRLVETCGTCHEQARPAFVAYDSHPDPLDPERNKPLFFSFVFMNTLLIGVLIVFGLHTALWWVRILIDHRRTQPEGGTHG